MVQQSAASTRFRETKALVRLALNDGLTQKEIAEQSRTSQSVVSAWANGKARAKQHQVAWLVERYGHQLQSKRLTVYLCPQPKETWEESEEAQVMAQLEHLRAGCTCPDHEEKKALVLKGQLLLAGYGRIPFQAMDEHNIHLAERHLREHHATGRATWTFARVDGPVVWRHLVDEGEVYWAAKTPSGPKIHWQPVGRLVVHEQARDTFILVKQRVRELPLYVREQWTTELSKAAERNNRSFKDRGELMFNLHSRADEGRWFSDVYGPFSKHELLSAIDDQLPSLPIHDQQTVPFLIRKMLIERGYDVGNTQYFR